MQKYHVLYVPLTLWDKLKRSYERSDYEKTPAFAIRMLNSGIEGHNFRPEHTTETASPEEVGEKV